MTSLARVPPELNTLVPIKLFPELEVGSSRPNHIPTICSLILKKVVVLEELEKKHSALVIAVKTQGSKNILRSYEFVLPPSGEIDTDLKLTFLLPNPHLQSGEGNIKIMLQRRKGFRIKKMLGYKTRAYKTLAVGTIHVAQVMQRPHESGWMLSLCSSLKEASTKVAEIWILSPSSESNDSEDSAIQAGPKAKSMVEEPEEEYESISSELEASSDVMHDQDLEKEDFNVRMLKRQGQGMVTTLAKTWQPNFKEEDVAPVPTSIVPEEFLCFEQDPAEHVPKDTAEHVPEGQEDFWYDTVENISNSSSDLEDDNSILSTPEPKPREYIKGLPHYSSQPETGSIHSACCQEEPQSPANMPEEKQVPRKNQPSDSVSDSASSTSTPGELLAWPLDSLEVENSTQDVSTEKLSPSGHITETTSLVTPFPSLDEELCLDMHSQLQIPRMTAFDHLNDVLIADDPQPMNIILVNTADCQGQCLFDALQQRLLSVMCTRSEADLQAAFSSIISWIERTYSCSSQLMMPVKIVVVGTQQYLNAMLRLYVEQLSHQIPDWLSYVCFVVIPLGSHPVASSHDISTQPMGLQVDYWMGAQPLDRGRDLPATKNTLKGAIQSLQNKKVMFLPKNKKVEPKSQTIKGISHLVCRAEHQQYMQRVIIDGLILMIQNSCQSSSHYDGTSGQQLEDMSKEAPLS
ncbi:phosphofurin acidic cluster sorting protein 2-like [Molossus nigricans]